MSIFRLFLASILITTTVYGFDPNSYDVNYGDAFLLFPFKQQECADPSTGFASVIQNSASSGFDTLMKDPSSTISCPEKGEMQNALNGVILTNDVSGENAGLISTGTLGGSGFVKNICLQTTTDFDGNEVCENTNIQFAVEIWFDYQPGVTFTDTNHVFLEISDASNIYFQLAYGSNGLFKVFWYGSYAQSDEKFFNFKEGLNHLVFRHYGYSDMHYDPMGVAISVNNERAPSATLLGPHSTVRFNSNAKLRIGDSIRDSNFKTAIHHVAFFKRQAITWDRIVLKKFFSDLFNRGLSNSYPVTNAKSMFVTIMDIETDINIAARLKSPNNVYDFDGDEIFLKLLNAPSNGYLDGTNGTLQVDEELSTANDIIFHSNAGQDVFKIENPNNCTKSNAYSSFMVQVGDEYGSLDNEPVSVYICVMQAYDPFSLKSNETRRFSYNGHPQRIALEYFLIDGSEENYTVSISSSNDADLTLFDGIACTDDVIPIDITSLLDQTSDQTNMPWKYVTFEFCIQLDHEEGEAFSMESVLLNWKASSKSDVGENTEDVIRVEFKNPISTCISDSDCKVETTEVPFVAENGAINGAQATFSISVQAPSLGTNETYFTAESLPSHGKLYRSLSGHEMKVGDRIELHSWRYGHSVNLYYRPNDDYFNRWNGKFENIVGETFHGCADPVLGCPDVATFLAIQSDGALLPNRATVEFFVEATTSYPQESDFKALVDSIEVVAGEFTPLMNGGGAVIQFNDRDHDTTMKVLEFFYSTGELRINESLFEENADILFLENCDTRVSNTTLPRSLAQNNATFPDSNATLPNNNNTTTSDCMVFASGVPSMLNSLLETLEFKTGESTTVTFKILSLDDREEVSTSLEIVIRDEPVSTTGPTSSTDSSLSDSSLSDGEIGAIVSVSTIAVIAALVTGYRKFTNSNKEILSIREAVDKKEDLATFL